ncbi:MAG: hypothetical protein H0V73_11595, partial [Chloroflexi bacterium]|nr:hypothetical protein [Chloroflexota bacterium]
MINRLVAASYPSDPRLLAELRAAAPAQPAPEPVAGGYAGVNLSGREPVAAVRLGDRHAVALFDEPDGSFLVVPMTRDPILVTSWRVAAPGDGVSAFVAGVP